MNSVSKLVEHSDIMITMVEYPSNVEKIYFVEHEFAPNLYNELSKMRYDLSGAQTMYNVLH